MKNFIYLQLIGLLGLFSMAAQAQNMQLNFDGDYDFVNIPDANALDLTSNFSIECWIYPQSGGNAIQSVISKSNILENNTYIFPRTDDSWANIEVYLHIGGSWQISTATFGLTNQWSHVAFTYDGSEVKTYINGRLAKTDDQSGNVVINNQDLTIGGQLEFNEWFKGYIDDVRIWNDVRSGQEIRSNMYKELGGSETNLVAYYKLNETSGITASDATGSHDGTLRNMSGTEWATSPAMFGPKKCLDFDGTDDKVTVPDNDNLDFGTDAFTIEGWLSNDQSASTDRYDILSKKSGSNDLSILINSNSLTIYTSDGTVSEISTSTSLSSFGANWFHFACVRQTDGTMQIYLNGALDNSSALTARNISSTGQLQIGNNNEFWDGRMDELRFWNDARTEAEIRENMYKNLMGSESGLVAYYPFDNGTGSPEATNVANTDVGNGTLTNMDPATDWVSSGAFNTWLNTNSDSFSTAANWSRGSVPGASDNVGIYNESGSDPSPSGAISINSLYSADGNGFSSGQSLTTASHAFFNNTIGYTGYTGDITVGGNAYFTKTTTLVGGQDVNIAGDLVTTAVYTLWANSTLTVTGNYNAPAEVVTLYGTATLGNYSMASGGNTFVQSSGVLNITGDFTTAGNITIESGGKVTVTGDVIVGTGASLELNGEMIVGGGGN